LEIIQLTTDLVEINRRLFDWRLILIFIF